MAVVQTLTTPTSTPLLIAGQERPGRGGIDVHDPARPDHVVGTAAAATPDDARDAVDAAASAWRSWRDLEPSTRARMLVDALAPIDSERERIVEVLVRENGKPKAEADVELHVFEARCRF